MCHPQTPVYMQEQPCVSSVSSMLDPGQFPSGKVVKSNRAGEIAEFRPK